MRKKWIAIPILALILFLLFRWQAMDKELVQARDSVRTTVRAETLAYHDTVRLVRRLLTASRAITDTLLRRDTVIHTDTVRVLVAAERAACDSAIAVRDRHATRQDSSLRRYDELLAEAIRRGRPSPVQFGVGLALTSHGLAPALAIIVRLPLP